MGSQSVRSDRSATGRPLDRARADGKAARRALPRREQGAVTHTERDPVAILAEQNVTRVPALVPIRIGRMLQSPFAFYRGAAAVMANDLAATPVTGRYVVSCGDAHLSNFGLFASPERRVLFDLNDFDEAYPAPWEWDVRRLAASVWIHGRDNSHSEDQCEESVMATLVGYRTALERLFELPTTDRYYYQVEADMLRQNAADGDVGKAVGRLTKKARSRTSQKVLAKVTTVDKDGESKILDEFPVIRHPDWSDLEGMKQLFARYQDTVRPDVRLLLSQYELVDYAMRIVGVGSVGTRCWLFYLRGPCGEPLFLQAKEAPHSVLQTYGRLAPEQVGQLESIANPAGGQGARVVGAQRVLQAQSDPFLGWVESVRAEDGVPRDYYIRQFRDMKGSVDLEWLTPDRAVRYGRLCGALLARAHSQTPDAGFISGYLGTGNAFVDSLAKWAQAYADRAEQDHSLLAHAVERGDLPAEHGV